MHMHALARFGVCFSRREADPGTVRKRDKSALKIGGIIVNIVKNHLPLESDCAICSSFCCR